MIEKIKVVSLANDLGMGGTARQIVTLDNYINKDIFDHLVISLSSNDNTRRQRLGQETVREAGTSEEAAKIIQEFGAHIVYGHRHGRNEPSHDALARLLTDQTIIHQNTFSAFDAGDFGKKAVQHVFVSQTNVVKYCRQNRLPFVFNKLKTVFALVDVNNFEKNKPTVEEIEKYRKKIGLRQGSFVVGRIARPVAEKWDDMMVLFGKRISDPKPDIQFVVYGVPENKKELLKVVNSNIIICDPTASDKELACFYSVIDVLVHASPIGECSSANIAEAMLFGKPIVVSSTPFPLFTFGRNHTKDNGQIEQIINGVNGYIVKNAAAMAKAVIELQNNKEVTREIGERNRKKVMENYDANIGVKTLEKTFIETLASSGKELSPAINKYAATLVYFPSEQMIAQWFDEYDRQLAHFYGKEYHNTAFEVLKLFWWKNKSRFKSYFR